MPELVTNIQSALAGVPDLAVGNIIGSNLSNILAGARCFCPLFFQLFAQRDLLKRDGAWLVFSLLLFAGAGLYGEIPSIGGALMVLLLSSSMFIASIRRKNRSMMNLR